MSNRKSTIFVISAPSGCGKTTLCRELIKSMPQLLHPVSVTTRPPRRDEKDGIDYNFVSLQKFNTLLGKGKFIEHARVFGNYYGTSKDPIKQALKNNNDMLLSIDVKGAMQVKKLFPQQSVLIFILPPSLEALKRRLLKRKADSNKAIYKRLQIAKKEMSYLNRYDYVVVNRRLPKALSQLKSIITAKRLKTEGKA